MDHAAIKPQSNHLFCEQLYNPHKQIKIIWKMVTENRVSVVASTTLLIYR